MTTRSLLVAFPLVVWSNHAVSVLGADVQAFSINAITPSTTIQVGTFIATLIFVTTVYRRLANDRLDLMTRITKLETNSKHQCDELSQLATKIDRLIEHKLMDNHP